MNRLKTGCMTAMLIITLSIVIVGCEPVSIFSIGDTVPDFNLKDQYGADMALSDEVTKPGMNGAILAFYILDNSPG